jgi:hemerythrin-like domain-containing protein
VAWQAKGSALPRATLNHPGDQSAKRRLIWINEEAASGADHAVIVEGPIMPEALGLLRQDHRNMVAVLQALEWQIKEFETGKQPDYEVIDAAMEYFLAFPDALHHPKEERIFEKLAERDANLAQQVGDLRVAHQELAARARYFATALQAVLKDAELPREAFARWAHGFIDVQRRHMAMEESVFFPAAARALAAEDWTDLDEPATGEEDPLISGEAGDKFELLRKAILIWQAQDESSLAKA